LEVGEALVSVLDNEGRPAMVERVLIAPPQSQIGALDEAKRNEIFSRSPIRGIYDATLDRESAFEMLRKRKDFEIKVEPPANPRIKTRKQEAGNKRTKPPAAGSRRRGDSITEAFLKSTVRSVGSALGRQLMRGLLGTLRR
ncbi:MAG TPA: DUF853 family protein, partial [Oligoflexia bacterium]|nr:DUF853 family protein [Oligoflexia bacterium]